MIGNSAFFIIANGPSDPVDPWQIVLQAESDRALFIHRQRCAIVISVAVWGFKLSLTHHDAVQNPFKSHQPRGRMMRIGFIGLGNVGGKLAGSLLRNGFELSVRDLDRAQAQPFLDQGAGWAETPVSMAAEVDMIITCLPNPAASAAVMEAGDGILVGLSAGKIWAEMSKRSRYKTMSYNRSNYQRFSTTKI